MRGQRRGRLVVGLDTPLLVRRLPGHLSPSWERTAPPERGAAESGFPGPGRAGETQSRPGGGARGFGEGGVGLID